MGGGSWDTSVYHSSTSARAAAGIDTFDYTQRVRSGQVNSGRATLDPKGMKNPDPTR